MFASLLAALAPQPIDLDRIGVDRARVLAGRPVVATFVAVKPTYTLLGRTVGGAADRDGEPVERGAVLRGRVKVETGKRLTVVGVLRVIEHPGAVVGGVFVPPWTEVRVEG